MNWQEILTKGMHKSDVDLCASAVVQEPKLFKELLDIVASGEVTPAMKAAWVLGKASELNRALPSKHVARIIELLGQAKISGVQRELIKTLFKLNLQEEEESRILDLCFHFLNHSESDVAVRHHALKILLALTKKYPDLRQELIASLEAQLEYNTAAWARYTRKTLAKLKQDKKRSAAPG
jgi:hypothetical protein